MTFITDVKFIQSEINALNEGIKEQSDKRNELMIDRTVACGEFFINCSAKGGQKEKAELADATNKKTQEETTGFWRRVAKLDPELKGADKAQLRLFLDGNEITSWRKIVAFGREPEELSKEAEALIEAMMLVCQDEGAGIVEGDGERDKVEQALISTILKLEKAVK